MTLPNAAIDKACFDLALSVTMEGRPVSGDDVRELAARFSRIAMERVYEPLDRNPELVARAIRYLAHVHAMPPLSEDTEWFSNMLEAVVEIARPNTGLDEEAKAFLDDLTEGIAIAREV